VGFNAYDQKFIAAHPGSGPFVPIVAGQCETLGPNLTPEYVVASLDQNNISWRTEADWKPIMGTLVYASINEGYKAGSFPTTNVSTYLQLRPAVQESLLAYEVGAKSRFWGNRIEVDGDVFYYDYTNKQLEGRVIDPIFTILSELVNIPKSHEYGSELSIKARPTKNLTLHVEGTYLMSSIDGNTPGYDGFGVATNFKGDSFPEAPRYSVLADVQYDWDLSNAYSAFVGINDRYRSKTQSQLGTYAFASATYPSPSTAINSYSLLGVRAGILSRDGHWRFQAFGNNVTNTYYWNYSAKQGDVTLRYMGMPATYGVTVDYTY
jgi:iron complex outermembrane receptor protein